MFYRILIVIVLLIVPVFANAKDISVFSDTKMFSNFIFNVKPDKKVHGSIIVKNEGKKDLNVKLSIDNLKEKTNAFSEIIFISDKVPEKYKEELQNKDNDLIKLCEDYNSDSDINQWCKGSKNPNFKIKADSEKKIDYIINFPREITNKTESTLNVFAKEIVDEETENDKKTQEIYTEKSSVKLTFNPIIERKINLKIDTLFLSRNLGTFDFVKWARQGFRETYNANITISNNSKNQKEEKIPFAIDLIIHPLKFNKEYKISKKGDIEKNVVKEQNFNDVAVPRFGSVLISAKIKYEDNGEEKVFITEPARIFIFPSREIICGVGILIFVWFLKLVWKNIKIKQEKKHKKKEVNKKNIDNITKESNNVGLKNNILKTQTEKVNKLSNSMCDLSTDDIDIEWMNDSGEYNESLKKQEKKLNRNISIVFFVLLIFLFVFMLIAFKGEPKKLNLKEEDASIVDLITQTDENNDDINNVNKEQSENVKEDDKSEIIKKIDNDEILIQVLNGGSPAGEAGKTVEILKKKGYKTNKADNAKENISGIIAYFNKNNKNKAEQVLDSVLEFKQGYKGKTELSEKIVKRYDGVDVVLVLGNNDKKMDKVNISKSETKPKIEILDGGGASENVKKIESLLKNGQYEIEASKKSSNTYSKTTIYFKSNNASIANKIHRIIEKTVDKVIREEADSLVNKYDSDIVIVVSK